MESTVDNTDVDLVAINIRGRLFQVERHSLMKQDGSRLQQIAKVHTEAQKEFKTLYFNRNSHLFESIADYCVSGKLHFSSCVCVNAFREEMEFWGVHETALDACCYYRYKSCVELEAQKQRMQTYWDFARNMRCESSRLMDQIEKSWKVHLYLLLEEPRSSMAAWVWSILVHIMTILSVSVVVLETVPSLRMPPYENMKDIIVADNSSQIFHYITTTIPCTELLIIEYITVLFLTTELALRFAVNPNKKTFFKSPLNVCDLMSQVPPYAIAVLFFVLVTFGYYESMGRAMIILAISRIIRIFRILHMAKHYKTVHLIGAALRESYRELLLLLVMLLTASVFFASLLFMVEVNYDNISDIPLAIWWALVTMTTIGYGDYHPISGGGYFIASLCAISGILIIALPTPIIVSNFNKLYDLFQTCERLAQRKKPEAIQRVQSTAKDNSINDKDLTKNKCGQLILLDVDNCNINNHASTSEQIKTENSESNELQDNIVTVKSQSSEDTYDYKCTTYGTKEFMHNVINDNTHGNNSEVRVKQELEMTGKGDSKMGISTVNI